MKYDIVDLKGKKQESKVTLDKAIWETPLNKDLVAQAVYVYQHNQRTGTAAAKTRAQVRGGGRKPWKQKGTGRARAGSIRSPLWVGGGVTFTPTNRNWKRKLNKKMVKKAVKMVLTQKLKDGAITFYKVSAKATPSTLRTGAFAQAKTLVVTEIEGIYKGIRNLPEIEIVNPASVNIFDLLKAKKVAITEESVAKLEARLVNGK